MRKLWHISDLHFSIGENGARLKDMRKFNKPGFSDWTQWDNKILAHWSEVVSDDDVVLVGGDNAWPTSAYIPSMKVVGSMPGRIYAIDGNHCKYVHKGIGRDGPEKFKKRFKEDTGITYLGEDFVCIGDTGILGMKLCDLPTNTFYSRYKEGVFQNELCHLENLVDKHKEDMLQCKNRIFLAHYPFVDDKLNFETSPWVEQALRFKATHCLYGHYHGPEVMNHLPNIDMEWNGIKFLNTSLDLHKFKMRKVLDDIG